MSADRAIDTVTISGLVAQLPSDGFFAVVIGNLPRAETTEMDPSVKPRIEAVRAGLDTTREHLAAAVTSIHSWWKEPGGDPHIYGQLVRGWPSTPEQQRWALNGEVTDPGGYRRAVQAIDGQLYLSGPVTPKLQKLLRDHGGSGACRELELAIRSSAATNAAAHAAAQILGHARRHPVTRTSSTLRRSPTLLSRTPAPVRERRSRGPSS